MNSITLDYDALVELTGKKRFTSQAKELDALGIPYKKRSDGSIVVFKSDGIKRTATAPTSEDIFAALRYKDINPDPRIEFEDWGGILPTAWYELNKPRFFFTLEQIASVKRSNDEEQPPEGSGVYFYFLGDDLQYIGQSKNLAYRFRQHLFPPAFMLKKAKWFTHWSAIWVPVQFLDRVEYTYINDWCPPRNYYFRCV